MDNRSDCTIAVVMPIYNAAPLLDSSVPPLLAMLDRREIDALVLVDDASTDESVARVAALIDTRTDSRLVRRTARGGPSAGRNDGARVAECDYVWFVDSDVVVAPDAARVLRAILRESRPTAVFGSYDDTPTAPNFLSQYKNLVHAYYHRRGRRDAATFWAGCGAIERAAFIDIGGFNAERYPYPSIEDIELGYRLRTADHRILSEPALRAKHLKAWRLGNLLHTDIFRRAIPWAALMLERGALTDDLNVSRGERIRAVVAGLCAVTLLAALARWIPVWVPLALIVVAFALNRALFAFFTARRGPLFAVGAFTFHQLQYLYSGGAFALAVLNHLTRGRARAR